MAAVVVVVVEDDDEEQKEKGRRWTESYLASGKNGEKSPTSAPAVTFVSRRTCRRPATAAATAGTFGRTWRRVVAYINFPTLRQQWNRICAALYGNRIYLMHETTRD